MLFDKMSLAKIDTQVSGWRYLAPLAFCVNMIAADCPTAPSKCDYPKARVSDQIDVFHGIKVADPYRWLEDGDSQETLDWIQAENQLTRAFLDAIPGREDLEARLTDVWNYEKFSSPIRRGDRYYYFKNNGLQNQDVLFQTDCLDSPGEPLLDPNSWTKEGTLALRNISFSKNGRYLAYSVSKGGSDWQEWHVLETESGKTLPDHIQWSKFSGASWMPDNSGFFYAAYDPPTKTADELTAVNYFQKLYFHKLGDESAEDELIYERPDHQEWGFGASVSEDGNYLTLEVWKGTHPENGLFYKDLRNPAGDFVELLNEFDASYEFLGSEEDLFWVLTDLDAPKKRIVKIDLKNPAKEHWKEVIPETDDAIQSVSLIGDQWVVTYLKDALSAVTIYDVAGAKKETWELPGIGTVSGLGGRRSDQESFFTFTSHIVPPTLYRVDWNSGKRTLFKRPEVDFDPERFISRQVFYPSKDGTKIPMTITHRKDLKLTGDLPTYLYGYGGFNISILPGFSASMAVWMEMGGVYAVPNLRGGGEYGEAWHEAGIKTSKQNVFDDFIAAAEWLIAEGYTNSEKIAISGRSNGGLLVGACLTQRPELFGAALPGVGVLDMLRFNKFTIGWAWESDYGSPEILEEFEALYSYSPYHRVVEGTHYPPTLITTAERDDRVAPAHSFKFAAALQAAHEGESPVLIRIETQAGHGAGAPTSKRIAESADQLAFLICALEMNKNLETSRTHWIKPAKIKNP